jgi:hypothetical protein
METWKKFAIVIAIVCVLVVPLTLLAVNFNGWGANLSKQAVPLTNGLHNIGKIIPTAMLNNGYIMLIGYLAVPVLMFASALIYWNQDWGYKITGGAPENGTLQNYTPQRAPEDAETLKSTTKGA